MADKGERDDTVRATFEPGAAATSPGAAHERASTTFAPGDYVAERYLIARHIASGGMGEVYEATDLELEGAVAIKTVRSHGAGDAARLKNELALARRVTHPNVCRLFDVGYHLLPGGREVAFFTMELLAGETLAAHLARVGSLSPAEALPIAVAIAAALEAAHGADIVHGDLKCHNVMLVPDGDGRRVVVTDFGLAHAGEARDAADGFAGTPAYVAPEQVARQGAITRAADIYSFGVVLFEMVTGALPFAGDTPMTRRLAENAPSPRRHAPGLDRRWEATILRCLEREPTRRFARASEIVAGLRGDRQRRRRRIAVAAAVGVLAAAGGAVFATAALRGGRPACEVGAEALAGLWGAPERAAIEAAFAATNLSYAEDAARGVGIALDAWGAELVGEEKAACQARRRGEQTGELLARRAACVAERRQEAGALVALLRAPTNEDVSWAVSAARALPSPARCGDVRDLLTRPPLPVGEERERVAAIRAAVARASQASEVGRIAEAKRALDPLVEQARATGYQPLIAEACLTLGIVEKHLDHWRAAAEALEEATLAAEASHDDWTVASSLVQLVEALGGARELEVARQRARHAEAAIARLGGNDELSATLARSLAYAAQEAGEHDEAIAQLHRAIALDEKRGDVDALATDRHDLAAVLLSRGDDAEGIALLHAVIAYYEETLGPHHPGLALALVNLAAGQYRHGALDDAEAGLERALAIYEASDGVGSARAANVLGLLGLVHRDQGKLDQARRELESAVAVLAAGDPDSHELQQARANLALVLADVGDVRGAEQALRALVAAGRAKNAEPTSLGIDLSNLANLLTTDDRPAEALPLVREGLALLETHLPAYHPSIGYALINFADAQRELGRLDEAEPNYRRAIDIFEKSLGADAPALAAPLAGLGRVLIARGRAGEARPLLERAVALRNTDPLEMGDAQLALAQVLARETRRARELAEAAVASYRRAGARAKRREAGAAAWLASH